MSDAKLQAAKELIQSKDYAAARSVLITMPDNVTAVKWLAKLDQIAPPAPPASSEPVEAYKRSTNRIGLVIFIALIIGGAALIYGINQQQQQTSEAIRRGLAEHTCTQLYNLYSTQWQNCVDSGSR